MSSIPDLAYSLVEIDHGIFSMVLLLLPLIQEGLSSFTNENNEYWLTASAKSVARFTDHLSMTIAIVLAFKHKPNKYNRYASYLANI